MLVLGEETKKPIGFVVVSSFHTSVSKMRSFSRGVEPSICPAACLILTSKVWLVLVHIFKCVIHDSRSLVSEYNPFLCHQHFYAALERERECRREIATKNRPSNN